MKFYKNLKIAAKLIIAFIIIALLSGVVGIVAIINTDSIINRGDQIYNENLVVLKPTSKIEIDFLKIRIGIRDLLLAKSIEAKAKTSNNIDVLYKDLQDNVQLYSKDVSSIEEANNLKTMEEYIEKYNVIKEQIRALINSNRNEEALTVMNGDVVTLANDLDANINKAFQINIDQAASRQAFNKVAGNNAVITITFVVIATIVMAIILGLVISKIIGKPINKLVEAAKSIAEGDLNLDVSADTKDEVGILGQAFQKIINSLKDLVKDSNMLAEAAANGKLDIRADTSKHNGEYKKIVEGVNSTLDAVIEPVKEAAAVLNEMSNGNLKVHVNGDYKGDHAGIKNALNNSIDSLASYVTEISEVLGEMSNSNLQLSINNDYKGDFAQIKDALNLIIGSFNEVFTEINNAADQVSSGASQVSDGSQALSQGTTEQASSIEELTASIIEVAAQTKQNATNASQANDLALNAKEGAILGNSHMKEMLRSMEEINLSSSNISKIIKVIDDIAFQTNILALNAAVEAARAGQHGKGFAVVAEEVRNLAARSANAAKETTDLIEGSIKKVEFGTKIANNTAESLDKIVAGVTKAATLVGEIAASSNEQATAISQINIGIEQVSNVVQTNSATAEESAAASEELSSQASVLKSMIGNFRLKRGTSTGYNEVTSGAPRNANYDRNKFSNHFQNTKTNNKPQISLSNKEFGKY